MLGLCPPPRPLGDHSRRHFTRMISLRQAVTGKGAVMAVDTRDFVPQRAIVTGSESGIGRSIAVALADLGCDVGVTWYRDEEMGKETAELVRAAGRRAELAHVDLTQLPAAADVGDELADVLGGVDVFVNDDGMGTTAPLLELSYEQWRSGAAGGPGA